VSATPTIYFIDDSATMREVIKIAFRRENINVVAYNDAASALGQIEGARPDVVITDVIMPDKDGYEVCQFIKQHPSLGKIPVILMSGVVNRAVAEKAFAVKADELIRKPFQPQDLITRVKHLLNPNGVAVATTTTAPLANNAAAALSSIFQTAPQSVGKPFAPAPAAFAQAAAATARPAAPAALAQPAPASQSTNVQPNAQQYVPPAVTSQPRSAASASSGPMTDMQKIRMEVQRLEGLVRKLQSELQAEREYTRSLEEHLKTLQDN
jgi:CheY-like chemotaxis protein